MGLVLLDVKYRVERRFGIDIPDDWWEQLGIKQPGDDVTVGQYHAFICSLCADQGKPVPPDSWSLLIRQICDASGSREADITTDMWLLKDIAPCG